MDYEKLGDNIRNYREQRGFTQEKLAELSNISEKHLSKIERGKINIKIDTLVNIADALGTSVDKLLLDASSFTKKARKITAVQYNGKQIHSGIESLNYNVLDGYSNNDEKLSEREISMPQSKAATLRATTLYRDNDTSAQPQSER